MKMKAELSKREWLLLSAYLDGQLSAGEETQVEELLQSKPASREALEALRRTRQVLQHASLRKVPRNFTLTEEMVQKPLLPSFSRVLSYSSALAGILLVLAFALDFYTASTSQPMQNMMTMESEAVFATEADMVDDRALEDETPEIINWGGPRDGKGDFGMSGYGIGGGADTSSAPGIGMGGGGAAGAVPQTPVLPEADIAAEPEAPEVMEEAVTEEYALGSGSEEVQTVPEKSKGNPILGIRTADKQGQILIEIPSEKIRETLPSGRETTILTELANFPWRLVEIALAAVVLLTGLVAFLSGKRR